MDTDVQWEVRKDAEKRRRYAPVLDFFSASHKRASWKLLQINFTVGVRGSISTAGILERVGQWTHSFVSSLERLGVSRKSDIERTRKAVAKRTFEAHDLMLRSYFAVKFSPSGQVDFAKIRTNSVALQHHIRPRAIKIENDKMTLIYTVCFMSPYFPIYMLLYSLFSTHTILVLYTYGRLGSSS